MTKSWGRVKKRLDIVPCLTSTVEYFHYFLQSQYCAINSDMFVMGLQSLRSVPVELSLITLTVFIPLTNASLDP